ncbi:MAG: hypothetical protein HC771_16135 [Synechococcales cyanobacterium CRU_2_2]|nr:hypothetical protein [Synechococcales cyanobacterium CRU_2_2]
MLEIAQSVDQSAVQKDGVVEFTVGSTKMLLFQLGKFTILAKGQDVINRFNDDPANRFSPLTKASLRSAVAHFLTTPVAAAAPDPERKSSAGGAGKN